MLVPRHSFTTRLLLACISSKLYHGHETLDDLFADIARQACELASNGITALWLIIVHFAIRTFPQNPMILCLAPTCLRPRARLKATPSNFWRLDWKVIGPSWERPCAWSKFVGFPYSVFGKCLIPKWMLHAKNGNFSKFRGVGWCEAYHLSTGWQCTRICHICTGKDWHIPLDSAQWHTGGPGETPYQTLSPVMDIPGLGNPVAAQLDYCHAFHLGMGLDMGASTIVLLCKLGHFGNQRALNNQLMDAFRRFRDWCHHNKKATSINGFSKLDFDMVSVLGIWSVIFLLPNP